MNLYLFEGLRCCPKVVILPKSGYMGNIQIFYELFQIFNSLLPMTNGHGHSLLGNKILTLFKKHEYRLVSLSTNYIYKNLL